MYDYITIRYYSDFVKTIKVIIAPFVELVQTYEKQNYYKYYFCNGKLLNVILIL